MMRLWGTALCVTCFLLPGCLGSLNYSRLIDAGGHAVHAAAVNEDELKTLSKQMRAQMDSVIAVRLSNHI